jgi:hypothetical protein
VSKSENPFVAKIQDFWNRALLTRDPSERLGCGVDGYSRVRAHALFATLDWATMDVSHKDRIF